MTKLHHISTDSLNLAIRTVSCIKGITNADGEHDAAVQQSIALSFAIDLEDKLKELDERLVMAAAGKVSDNNNENKILEVDCMLGQIKSILSCVFEDVTDSHMAGLLGGAITITNTAQKTLNS